MRAIFVSWLGALLAACTSQHAEQAPVTAPSGERPQAEGSATNPTPAPHPALPALASVTSLAGEWRVAGLDGAEFDEPYGLALRGDGQELWWEPRCARVARSYRIEGSVVRFGPPLGTPPPSANAPSPPVCAIALPPRMADVTRALDAADTVGRTANNGVEISGGDHSLLLFSQ